MADTASGAGSGTSGGTAEPLDVFSKLFDTVALIAKHQAASQGATNTADVAGKATKSKDAVSPFEALTNLIQLGAAVGDKAPELMKPPDAAGGGIASGLKNLFDKPSDKAGGAKSGGGGGDVLSQLSDLFKGGSSGAASGGASTLDEIGSALGSAGSAIGSAAGAAGETVSSGIGSLLALFL